MHKVSGDLILSLPASLSCLILSEWIGLKGLARLDSAHCRRETRIKLLNLMKFHELVSSDWLSVDRSTMLRWVLLREVKVARLACNPGFNQQLLTDYIQRNERHIQYLDLQAGRACALECRNLLDLSCYFSSHTVKLLAQNPHLRSLNITQGLDNRCLKEFNQICLPNLRIISVFLRDSTCSACLLAILCSTIGLQELHVQSFNLAIDTQTWVAFAQHCKELRMLTINYIHIQDEAVGEFTRLCPHIAHFAITDSDDITDEGVLEVVQNLKNLRSLDLRNCEQLTDESVVYIAQYCANTLEVLYLCNELISESAVIDLQRKCKKLCICEWTSALPTGVNGDDGSESD